MYTSTEDIWTYGMMPFTATRHPAVLFLSGINVTTPSASVIGSALTHTHLLILDLQSVPKPHKNNHFLAKETLLYLLATTSYHHPKESDYQISISEPLQSQLATVCHQRQRIILTNHVYIQSHFH